MASSLFSRLVSVILAMILLFLLSATALAAEAYQTTTRVNLRKGPSTGDAILKTLNAGVTVQVEEYKPDDWSKVSLNGSNGYIKSEYIKKSQPADTKDYRTTARVNFRKSPAFDGEVIKVLNAGTAVTVENYEEGGWSRTVWNGTTGYIKSEYVVKAGEYDRVSPSDVELINWSEAKSIFKTYTPAKITDVRSGAVYYVQSFSNGKHADVETLTKADTDILHKTFGYRWQWSVRPVWVTIGGRTMAASINGKPHGRGTISGNGMNGQVCIHFKGSTTHNGNRRFAREHQNGVTEAWNAAQR